MKLRSLLCLAFLGATSLASVHAEFADKDKVPPIAYVQGMIWNRLKFADFTLTGVVRSDKTRKSYPIILRTKDRVMVYEFQDQPLQLRIQLNPGAFIIQKRAATADKWAAIPAAEMAKPILGTDITYQDLVIDFVNWDNIEPLGIDSIKTLESFVFEARPGKDDHSPFASIRFWVSKQYWAFLRIDGLNANGQTVKRVEVQDVMQIGKFYVFKQMKVANMVPDKNDIAASSTFIDISEGKEGSGL